MVASGMDDPNVLIYHMSTLTTSFAMFSGSGSYSIGADISQLEVKKVYTVPICRCKYTSPFT